MRRILVLGATSAIAQEAARAWAERGEALHLVARNGQRLGAVEQDLRTRGAAQVTSAAADLDDCGLHAQLLEGAERALGGSLDVVLLAQGVLGKPGSADPLLGRQVLHTNLVSPSSLLLRAAAAMSARGQGCIAAISSVAGDRGRGSNLLYGASKAGLDALLSGLRNHLARSGVHVVTIKPGFVDTPMTAHLRKGLLFASARTVGRGIVRAVDARRDVVYLPGFWRAIMWVVRNIPERIFKRLSL